MRKSAFDLSDNVSTCACRKPKPEHIDDAVRARLTTPLAAPFPASPAIAPPTAPNAAPRPRAAQQSASRRLAHGRGSRSGRSRRRIEPGLLGRPSATLPVVALLLLDTLAFAEVDEKVVGPSCHRSQRSEQHSDINATSTFFITSIFLASRRYSRAGRDRIIRLHI